MPRLARIVVAGMPHHVTQRGNNRQSVFLDEEDRKIYLALIRQYSTRFGISVLAYCLMPNHVHFIVIPIEKNALARVFNTAHMRYSQHFNRKTARSGHLWRGRFYSCLLDEKHLLHAARYVERNPVRAKLVDKPWQWKWSSALDHINREEGENADFGEIFKLTGVSRAFWKSYIDSPEPSKILHSIRKQTQIGRPLGTAKFIQEMEEKIGRCLSAPLVGRPEIKHAV